MEKEPEPKDFLAELNDLGESFVSAFKNSKLTPEFINKNFVQTKYNLSDPQVKALLLTAFDRAGRGAKPVVEPADDDENPLRRLKEAHESRVGGRRKALVGVAVALLAMLGMSAYRFSGSFQFLQLDLEPIALTAAAGVTSLGLIWRWRRNN